MATPTMLSPTIAIPMFATWILLMITTGLLLKKQKVSKKTSSILYLISFIVGGFLLGGTPNTVAPIQQIFLALGNSALIQSILPLMMIILFLVLTGFFIGRLFCGVACPLGTLQELISRIFFKSTIKKQKTDRFKIQISSKFAQSFRWVFFIVMIGLTTIWSIAILQIANPFSGFQIFKTPSIAVIAIPLVFFVVILLMSIFIYRPWCRLFCPFGALSSLSSKYAKLQLRRTEACTNCSACERVCPTNSAGSDDSKAECYLCGRCIEVCPQNAITWTTKS